MSLRLITFTSPTGDVNSCRAVGRQSFIIQFGCQTNDLNCQQTHLHSNGGVSEQTNCVSGSTVFVPDRAAIPTYCTLADIFTTLGMMEQKQLP